MEEYTMGDKEWMSTLVLVCEMTGKLCLSVAQAISDGGIVISPEDKDTAIAYGEQGLNAVNEGLSGMVTPRSGRAYEILAVMLDNVEHSALLHSRYLTEDVEFLFDYAAVKALIQVTAEA